MGAVAVVNVRMGSQRLAGKVLREMCGRPLLSCLLARLRGARSVERVVVATSQLEANDAIDTFCVRAGVECFRGPEDDVLARTLGALRSVDAETGVIVFGDGPLIDPRIVDRVVETYLQAAPQFDFVGNDLATTYPPGMEVEAFSVAALTDADRRCTDHSIREHGTLYLRRNPQRYRLHNLEAPPELRRPELELEVDTEIDLEVIARILRHFGERLDFTLREIIEFLDAHPDVARLNRTVHRRWRRERVEDASRVQAET
jgi:spore coat polysaccharide biosynthesis protein SpsF (cytidylyltransferase family)